MSDPTLSNKLQQLLDLEIINTNQRDQALNHPQTAELDKLESLSEVLFWLINQRIYPLEDFEQFLLTESQSAWLGTEKDRQRLPIIAETHAILRYVRTQLNLKILNQAVTDKLINEIQQTRAESNLPDDVVFGSTAELLAWAIVMEYITPQELETLRSSIAAEPNFAGAQMRTETLAGAELQVKTIISTIEKATNRAMWKELFSGSGWMWAGGAILAFAWLFWPTGSTTRPEKEADSPPACTSAVVQKTLDNMMLRARLESSVGQRELLNPEATTKSYLFVQKPIEVGYAKVDHTRGCLATLNSSGVESPYAFTISPQPIAPGEKQNLDDFIVIGADPDIVKARFSNITAEGNYAQLALPIGRKNLDLAFRAGVEHFEANSSDHAVDLAKAMQQLRPKKSILSKTDANREREIAEIEPTAPCQTLEKDKRYRCPLMIERNDPLLAAIGRNSNTIIKSDFTFELDPSSKTWKVSDSFAKEYVESITKGRLGLLKDTESSDSNEAPPAASAVSQ